MMFSKDFAPNWASAPGETIADILRNRDVSDVEFAREIGQSVDFVQSLLQGRSTITIAIARQLQRSLGGTVEFWIARDFQFRQQVARLHGSDNVWLSQIPLGDMIRFGWLSPTPHPSEEVAACLRFFGVANTQAWHDRYANLEKQVAFRTSPSFDSRPAAVIAWLRQGEIEAGKIDCDSWNAREFQANLPQVRLLTREPNPDKFIPALKEYCARAGVALVVVRAPTACRASGATWFLSPQKAVLQLSFRYLTDDHFWFTFFHEAGHLLLHGEKGFFLEGPETTSTKEEFEANEFAARILVPSEFQGELIELGADSRQVIRFARRIGISRGIVVGQLQHLGKLRHEQLNHLKCRYKWID